MTTGCSVLVVDDHPVLRRGLRTMLEAQPWVAEVLEAENVAEAVRNTTIHAVHVIAMDVGLPDGDGIEATRRILKVRPDVQVLIFTMTEDEELVERALRAGARGYVLKSTDPEVVVEALHTIAGGGLVLGPKIGSAVLTTLRRSPVELPAPLNQLTTRERDILTRLANGDNPLQIARQLGVAEKTIRNQLSPIFAKLGVTDRIQAALLARDAGIGT